MTIRLLLVDDQELVRSGLRQVFALDDELEVVAEAADGNEALRILAADRVDCVVMDIRMRGLNGIDTTVRIRTDGGPPVLALTTFDDDETLWGAIDAGVAGFVLKEASATDIIRATRTVAAGGAWLDPTVTGRVLAAARHQPGQPGHPDLAAVAGSGPLAATPGSPVDGSRASGVALTPREAEVLALIASGANNAEIATQLQVGAATVKTHVSAIFTKLGARDRAAAIIYAHRHGLVR